jgi:GT2 family glycosyltransferase
MVSLPRPEVFRNDYGALRPPEPGRWTPELNVSVVVPAHGGQDKLDLVLAALAGQSYPSHLMEVVVVDDASDPPLALPEIRPDHTKLVSADPGGWGSAHAVNTGAARSEGAVILRLDADMLAYHDHVESQMRWHHTADYLAVLGHKLFVDHTPGTLDPKDVHAAVQRGQAATLFDRQTAHPHWVERFIDTHNALRDAGHMAYHVFVGATGSVRRDLFTEAGGMDASLALGGDAEFAYRLAQAGAVFVPDHDSSSWHLGRSQMQTRREEGNAYRDPFLANRVPLLTSRRDGRARQWEVPYVDVVIDCRATPAAQVRNTVTGFLAGDTADIRITLVGAFDRLSEERRAPLDEDLLDLRLIRETFRAEPRVRLCGEPPAHDPAVTFRLSWPAEQRPSPGAIAELTGAANDTSAGLVRATPPGTGTAPRLERTAAYARARRLAGGEAGQERLDTVVGEVFGLQWVDGAAVFADEEVEVEPPPADWSRQLNEARQRARSAKKRAERLERRIRWATRAQPKRLLRRLILGRRRR